jgi:hypothetical protein
MNFQQVKQANGNNITLFATFNEVGGVALTQNQKQVCKCQLIDDNREKHLVRLYGTMPTPALLNMRQEFSLSSYQGKNQQGQPYVGYSGFWNDRAMVNQVPSNAPQAPHTMPQTPQYRPQQPNVPQTNLQGLNMPDTYAYPVTPETARRMARVALMVATLRNGQVPLLSYITELVEYSMTGIEPSKVPDPHPSIQNNPDYVGDDPPPPIDGEIPF